MAEGGVIHTPEVHRGRRLDHDSTPALVVGDQGRAFHAVDGHLVDHPDTVERGLWRTASVSEPPLLTLGIGRPEEKYAQKNLRCDAKLNDPPPTPERRFRGRFSSPV